MHRVNGYGWTVLTALSCQVLQLHARKSKTRKLGRARVPTRNNTRKESACTQHSVHTVVGTSVTQLRLILELWQRPPTIAPCPCRGCPAGLGHNSSTIVGRCCHNSKLTFKVSRAFCNNISTFAAVKPGGGFGATKSISLRQNYLRVFCFCLFIVVLLQFKKRADLMLWRRSSLWRMQIGYWSRGCKTDERQMQRSLFTVTKYGSCKSGIVASTAIDSRTVAAKPHWAIFRQ